MKTLILTLLLTGFAFSETLTGTARNDKGEVVYIETHDIQRDSTGRVLFIETNYVNAAGKKIARMISDFKQDAYLPDCKFEDFRFERVFDGKLTKTDQKPSVYTIVETKSGKAVKTSNLEVKEKMILGSGFDNFIFESMVKNNISEEKIHFVVLARHDFYGFDVKKIGSDVAADQHYRIKASSFVIKMFVKEIDIFYQANTRKLTQYKGLSNLPSDADSAQDVVIEYGKGE